MTSPIPSPPGVPFLGHVNTIDRDLPVKSIDLLAQQYGEIYQLSAFGQKRIVVSSRDLVNEVSDEKRFRKKVSGGLKEVRNAAGDGLFTAFGPEEQNWGIAHRLLMPCFGTVNILNMYDDMMDVTSQLVLKWERFGAREMIDPAADFTRLTLDAICLCAMSYRLNSFYREEPHPFATAMTDFLIESGRRSRRLTLVQAIMSGTNAKYEEDQRIMGELVSDILEDHRANPPAKPDLVQVMLTGRDKETGLGLSDASIKHNLLTFLIAGHETTSGMLTFTIYFLLKNPEALRKLREEVDTKLGDRPMGVQDVNKFPYLLAVMRESLRLGPTAPGRVVTPIEDTVLAGKYAVEKGVPIIIGIYTSHRDPKVWGEDADKFRPERMLDGKFEALPPNAWQPFGYGSRGCIGRPFAWQEAQIALVTIMQRFDLVMHDPTYELELKQTLTIKPHNFYIHALPRKNIPRLLAIPSSTLLTADSAHERTSSGVTISGDASSLHPLYVLYGSNTGTSEAFAQRLASAAASHGFHASLGTLDSATSHLPKDGPVLIVTASFEGQPSDNAKHFVEWLENVKDDACTGIKYAVFGCGNKDWVNTYQRIPMLIDRLLDEHDATRLVDRGEGDAAAAEFFETFDRWEKTVWEKLGLEFGAPTKVGTDGFEIKTVSAGTERSEILRQKGTALGTVVENKILTAPGAPVKRHIEFDLPEGMTYRTGDYLAILPVNPDRVVRRAIVRLGLSAEQEIEINSVGPTSLPIKKPISIYHLLSGYVELQQPATTRDLDILLSAKNSPTSTQALQDLSSNYSEKVFKKRLSVLDILEENKDIEVSLSTMLKMLPSMRIRQYSISSSPLWNAERVSLTLSIVDAPALSGRAEPFLGVASTFLAGLRPGDKVQLAVRASNAAFHPPSDLSIPLVMICAGSGLAPMRGFLQERAMQKLAGRDVAKSLLFFGCRSPQEDFLYGDSDLKEWHELGIVDIRPAFSRSPTDSENCRYVQDRIRKDKDLVATAFDEGAKFYVCGAGKIAAGVKQAIVDYIKQRKMTDEAAAVAVFDQLMEGRYATDIFE
ncbi:bifunctional P-450/NADPH-P450 reductase [Lentinus tigrinus ALCF2SS1-7]|uniref:Bifunctional P-450/NADPH-P450 reductase n=1 Tax=Lentinus tigrinus ALCF2SS1-6 TaxID=1328759 RepID=A0A5C2S7V2_9APHY|nr:bifunctional P-450/NADPH-P450 reductase [Lentinus tigrinus ALCF2SS1-6]RPD72088.1 bifunctional P-450/NADPH-P450 reductase [Lentinus tigrinus ALCF2SS1-7]